MAYAAGYSLSTLRADGYAVGDFLSADDENARSALEGGVEPPQTKVPSAQVQASATSGSQTFAARHGSSRGRRPCRRAREPRSPFVECGQG